MGLFDFLFKNRPQPTGQYGGEFKLLNGYIPNFTSFGGGIYESELIRAAIEFNDMEVEEILTPRVDIVAAGENASMEELNATFSIISQSAERLQELASNLEGTISYFSI